MSALTKYHTLGRWKQQKCIVSEFRNPELLKSGSVISACYHRQTPSEGSGAESLLAASSFWRLLAIPGTPCLCQRDSSLPSLDTTFFPVCLLCLLLTETPVIQFRIHPVPRWALQVLCIHASPGYGQVLEFRSFECVHSSISFWLCFVVPWCLLMLSIISHTYWSVRNLPW